MLFLTRDRLAAAFLAAVVAAYLAFAPSAIAGEPGGDGVVEKLDSAELARGNIGGADWSLRAFRQRVRAPLPATRSESWM